MMTMMAKAAAAATSTNRDYEYGSWLYHLLTHTSVSTLW
jgi:hypothetical protein